MSPVPNERRPKHPGDPVPSDTNEEIREITRRLTGESKDQDSTDFSRSLESLSPADHLLDDENADQTGESQPGHDAGAVSDPSDSEATQYSQSPELSRLTEATFAPDHSEHSRATEHSLEATFASQAKKNSDHFDNADTDTRDDIPKNIGRYRVRRLLGEGAFGKVYECMTRNLTAVSRSRLPS